MHNGNKKSVWLILACILVALSVGSVFAKYQKTVKLNSVNFTVSGGKLAEACTLKEHVAVQNSDGTYSLGAETATSNRYGITPGITLPKDPYFTVEGKSKVAAYLYVEIADSSAGKLSYSLTDDWMALGLTGEHGGSVYVYTGGTSSASLLTQDFSADKLYVLQNNQISVSQTASNVSSASLDFYGYLAQASLAENAADVFTTCFGGE